MKPSELEKSSSTEYVCEHCSKASKSAAGLTSHRKSHRKSHKCQFCDKVFRYADTLQDHTSEYHPDQLEKLTFSCRDCLKWFPTELALQGHMESSHSGPPKCMCEWCGRTVRKDYLPEHYRIHQQIPHNCEFCSKSLQHPRTSRGTSETVISTENLCFCSATYNCIPHQQNHIHELCTQ